MKVEFNLEKKKFVNQQGNEIEFYVLKRTLIDGTTLEVTIKGDKAKLLLMSIYAEKSQK